MNATRLYIPDAPDPAPSPVFPLPVELRDLVRVLDAVPLERILRIANAGGVCPSSTCSGRVRITGPGGWLCPRCFALGGSAAYWLMLATGWTYDELHDAIDVGADLEVRRG